MENDDRKQKDYNLDTRGLSKEQAFWTRKIEKQRDALIDQIIER